MLHISNGKWHIYLFFIILNRLTYLTYFVKTLNLECVSAIWFFFPEKSSKHLNRWTACKGCELWAIFENANSGLTTSDRCADKIQNSINSVCLSTSISLSVSLYVCLSDFLLLSISLSVQFCLTISLFLCLYVYLSVCPFLYMYVHRSPSLTISHEK